MSKQPARSRTNRWSGKFDGLWNWFPVLCRMVAVLIVSVPAIGKFYQYSGWVVRFDAWGIPWPAIAVLVTGILQLGAILSLLFGIAGRVGASTLVVIMIVAMIAAGPDAMNVAVAGSSVVIVVLGTGPYSRWDPQFSDLFESAGQLFTENETLSS